MYQEKEKQLRLPARLSFVANESPSFPRAPFDLDLPALS